MESREKGREDYFNLSQLLLYLFYLFLKSELKRTEIEKNN